MDKYALMSREELLVELITRDQIIQFLNQGRQPELKILFVRDDD